MTAEIGAARWRDRALVGAALLAIVILLAQLVDFGYGRDQGIYAAVGRTILRGGAPYRDAWDFKPPGIFFIYALTDALPGSPVRTIRAIEALSLVSLVGGFALLSRRYLGDARPGVLGGAFAIFTHVQLEFWHTGQPESFGAVAVTWGIVAAASATASTGARRTALWVTSGALYGIAALLKPTIGIAAAASLAIGIRDAWRPSREGRVGRVTAVAAPFAAGIAVPLVACGLFFAVRGGLRELWDAVFVFAPQYTARGWEVIGAALLVRNLVTDWLFGFSLINGVGLLLVAMPPHAPAEREGIAHVALAILLLLVGVVAQLKLFPYHFGSVLPLTALLAAWGFWKLWLRVSDRWYGAVAVAALIALLAAARSATIHVRDSFAERCRLRFVEWTDASQRLAVRDRLYTVFDYDAHDNRLVEGWIARETPPAATLFIWGFTPEIYVLADRRPANRFIYDVPQRAPWSRDAEREALMRELTAAPPDVILVEHEDVIPLVTGLGADSAYELRGFDALRALLASRYRRVAYVKKFDVYRRAN
jgi:dolichyl-phosphate-mannose-protein mannosyltransferase